MSGPHSLQAVDAFIDGLFAIEDAARILDDLSASANVELIVPQQVGTKGQAGLALALRV